MNPMQPSVYNIAPNETTYKETRLENCATHQTNSMSHLVDGQQMIDKSSIVRLPIVDALNVVEVRVHDVASAMHESDREDI